MEYICKPIHEARNWQAATYFAVVGGERFYAFHERTYFPHFGKVMAAAMTGGEAPIKTEYWLGAYGDTKEDVVSVLKKIGLDPENYYILDEFYGDGYFPACANYEDATKFFEASWNHKTLKELNYRWDPE
jgi:hypothetical protein